MTTLLDPKALAARLGVSTITLSKWRVRGTGPRFVKVGARRVGYSADEVDAWLASRPLQRSTSDHGTARGGSPSDHPHAA